MAVELKRELNNIAGCPLRSRVIERTQEWGQGYGLVDKLRVVKKM